MSEFTLLVQLLISGILLGAMYGIAAIGLSLIFGTMRIIFVAQGSVIIFFSYVSYWLFTSWGIDPYLAIVIVIPLALLLGLALYYGLFQSAAAMDDRNVSLLIALGLMFLVENVMVVLWTANPRTIVTGYTEWVLRPLGFSIPFTRLIAFAASLLAAGLVFLFLKHTFLGTALRAASENMQAATLLGINPHRVNAVGFAIGIALAGIAGIGISTVFPFDPMYGFGFALKALIALALGGLGNVFGGLVGGLLLGVIESIATYYVGGGWTDAISFAVFLVVLSFFPYGLFGQQAVHKA